MKDRRGAVGRATGLAESVAAAVRRRQQSRLPRAVAYDAAGEPRLVSDDDAGHEELLDAAELLVELALHEEPEAPPDAGSTSAEGSTPATARRAAGSRGRST